MTQDTKDKSAEALQRLEMLLSLGWVVTSMGRPLASTALAHENDYCIGLASATLFATSRVAACDPDLATAITKAINLAAKLDPTFRSFEKAVSDDAALTATVIANCAADLAEDKYDNWEPKPKPPIGTARD